MLPLRDNIPSSRVPWVTLLLIALNALAFLWELKLGQRLGDALDRLALIPIRYTDWDVARHFHFGEQALPFFSSMFLHGGWLHLLGQRAVLEAGAPESTPPQLSRAFGVSIRVRKNTKRWILGALAAAVVAAAAWLLWPKYDALEAWKAAQRARGETFDLTELMPPYSARCQEMEAAISNAINRLIPRPLVASGFELMSANGDGQGRVAIRAAHVPVRESRDLAWAEAGEQMSANAPILQEIDALLENFPAASARDFARQGRAAGDFSLIQKRKLAQMLAAAAVVEAQRGQIVEAQARLHTLFRLARWHEDEATLVIQMINVAIAGLATAATWEVLQMPGWDDRRLAALQDDMGRASVLSRLARTVRRERAWSVSAFENARTNKAALNRPMFNPAASVGVLGDLRGKLYGSIWQMAWSGEDELRLLRSMEFTIAAAQAGASNRSFAAMQPALTAQASQSAQRSGPFNAIRYPLSDTSQWTWDKALKSLMRQECRLQLARAAIAIERHRLRHGQEPATIEALVPEFAAEVPWDYMIGAPLHYRRNPNGRYHLWSVGENLRDDDARGDDLVWLEPESMATP